MAVEKFLVCDWCGLRVRLKYDNEQHGFLEDRGVDHCADCWKARGDAIRQAYEDRRGGPSADVCGTKGDR